MNNIRNNKGQALVEFAIILPILLIILMGIIEFGMMMNSYLTIQNAAREGARLGIVGGTDIEINTLITKISPSLNTSDLNVSISPDEVSRNPGDTLDVNITYKYHMTVPIISAILGNEIDLHAVTSMRIE